ncbi:MAG: hypothetical protein HOP24_08275 [Sideroxydans sp.]|nr:hypothetical protein [Sideroxydans sp.]
MMRYTMMMLLGLALAACADPARNLYEGIKASNDAKRTPSERAISPAPSYDQYKKDQQSAP